MKEEMAMVMNLKKDLQGVNKELMTLAKKVEKLIVAFDKLQKPKAAKNFLAIPNLPGEIGFLAQTTPTISWLEFFKICEIDKGIYNSSSSVIISTLNSLSFRFHLWQNMFKTLEFELCKQST